MVVDNLFSVIHATVFKFDKMTSGFVITSIKLCPPSGLLEPPPGSRQKTPGPDEV